MKQFDLFNDNKQKISIVLANGAFDCNKPTTHIGGPEATQVTCLHKLATYFFRHSFLKKSIKKPEKPDSSSYTLQIYVKALYSLDDDYNDVRVYYNYRILKDGKVIAFYEPSIIKISNLNKVVDIANCIPQPFENEYEKGINPAHFEKKFTEVTRKRWEKRLSDVVSTAPIPEEDEKFIDISNQENAKKNILIAIYNAAREYYRDIWEDKDNFEKNKAKFNAEFAGLVSINDEGKLSPLADIFAQENRELTHFNRDQAFDTFIDEFIKRCADTRYTGVAYLIVQKHLNLLNEKADYFHPIEPVYGAANAVPLATDLIDAVTGPINLIGINTKRKDFEFKPHMLGKGAPSKKPTESNNPFDLAFDQQTPPDSPPPPLHLLQPSHTEPRTAAPGAPSAATANPKAAENIRRRPPAAARSSQHFQRRAAPHPSFPDQITRTTLTPTNSKKMTFWEKHPVWKKTLIGALIGFGIAVAVAVGVGFLMFPPVGAAALAATVTVVAASGKIGMLAAIVGGILLMGTLIGGGIGASVGASDEKKREQRIATSLEERDKALPRKSPFKPRRTITRFTANKPASATSTPAQLPRVERLDLRIATPASPPLPPKKTSPEAHKPQPPMLSPTVAKKPASTSFLREVGGHIPGIGTLIKPQYPSPTAEEFKKDLLLHYAGLPYGQTYEQVIAGHPGAKIIVDTYSQPQMYSFIFSKPMLEKAANVRTAIVNLLTSPKYQNFNFEYLEEDDSYKKLAEIVAIVRSEMESTNTNTLKH